MLSSNDLRLLREAAVRGLGIALLPQLVIGDLIERGLLVQVLPGIVEAENNVAVVYPEREFLPPQVRAFVDVLVAWSPALKASSAPRAEPPRRASRKRKN